MRIEEANPSPRTEEHNGVWGAMERKTGIRE